jgi:hypothetical protein
MNKDAFDAKMTELLDKIGRLPESDRGSLEDLANQTKERRDRIQTSVAELQESIDYLRLSVKYLVFDLEATRRENAYLRRLLEEHGRDAADADQDADENEGETFS